MTPVLPDAYVRLCQVPLPNTGDSCKYNVCRNGLCVPVPGSYRCECHLGFKNDETGSCVGKVDPYESKSDSTSRCNAYVQIRFLCLKLSFRKAELLSIERS